MHPRYVGEGDSVAGSDLRTRANGDARVGAGTRTHARIRHTGVLELARRREEANRERIQVEEVRL